MVRISSCCDWCGCGDAGTRAAATCCILAGGSALAAGAAAASRGDGAAAKGGRRAEQEVSRADARRRLPTQPQPADCHSG